MAPQVAKNANNAATPAILPAVEEANFAAAASNFPALNRFTIPFSVTKLIVDPQASCIHL